MNLNRFGEVADFCYPVDQFGKSPDACGPYASGYIRYMGEPGKGPTGKPSDIDQWAFNMYTKYIGPDISTNTNGTDVLHMYAMLADAGYYIKCAFLQLDLTVAAMKQSIALGRPVVVAAAETGMHDMDNGNKVDYSWTPSGSHIVTISGVRGDGALLVRDPANIGATGQRGSGPAATHDGPLAYNPATFGPIVSATSIITPWELNGVLKADTAALHNALAPLGIFAQAVLDALKLTSS